MSKGLIDLTRANQPPANPLTESTSPAETILAPEPANSNTEPQAVASVDTRAGHLSERVSTIGARIPESLHQAIKLFCIANRIEMQHFVQEGLSLHLERLQAERTETP